MAFEVNVVVNQVAPLRLRDCDGVMELTAES
jgi:hypothetical protein